MMWFQKIFIFSACYAAVLSRVCKEGASKEKSGQCSNYEVCTDGNWTNVTCPTEKPVYCRHNNTCVTEHEFALYEYDINACKNGSKYKSDSLESYLECMDEKLVKKCCEECHVYEPQKETCEVSLDSSCSIENIMKVLLEKGLINEELVELELDDTEDFGEVADDDDDDSDDTTPDDTTSDDTTPDDTTPDDATPDDDDSDSDSSYSYTAIPIDNDNDVTEGVERIMVGNGISHGPRGSPKIPPPPGAPEHCVRGHRIAYSSDCKKYYRCNFKNTWKLRTCRGKEKLFDSKSLKCKPQKSVTCLGTKHEENKPSHPFTKH